MAAKNVNEGRKAAAFNVLLILPISAIVVSNAGWIGRAIANGMPGILPAGLQPNDVFVAVTNIVASPGVFGFIIAALCAALMSTADTLVNASSAIVVNDIYRPLMKKEQSEKKQLEVARYASIGIKVIGVLLVPFFNSFESIYEAHGWFHSTFTPPLVVAVFLGIFWKRFTTPAVIATFTVGAFLMILGQYKHELIAPFSHGIELRPGKGYSYIGALYNIFVCASVGVIVSLLTKPPSKDKVDGLTVYDVSKLKASFKGGKVNDAKGKTVIVDWEISDIGDDSIRFSKNDMSKMKAKVGDLVYLCDNRKWLGGLKSIHSVYGEPHDTDGVVMITKNQQQSGLFDQNLKLFGEKEM
jgi:SSS family solute:Na+ symporter